MEKKLFKKFVVTASDYEDGKPHLRADGYRAGQMLKAGLSMCMTAEGRKDVRRKDALGQPVTVTLSEHLVDDQGHECDANGTIVNPNQDAHNFTIIKRGFLEVTGEKTLRPAQVFIPEYDESKVRWALKPITAHAVGQKASASAEALEAQAKALRAKADALKPKKVEAAK